jgi:hypothetical protein
MAWPSGDFSEIAMIDVSHEEVQSAVSTDLIEGVEPGLGAWKAIGIKLDGGEVIELIRYASDPDKAFTLRVDARENFLIVLGKVLKLLKKDKDSLVWVSPLAADDGVRFTS